MNLAYDESSGDRRISQDISSTQCHVVMDNTLLSCQKLAAHSGINRSKPCTKLSYITSIWNGRVADDNGLAGHMSARCTLRRTSSTQQRTLLYVSDRLRPHRGRRLLWDCSERSTSHSGDARASDGGCCCAAAEPEHSKDAPATDENIRATLTTAVPGPCTAAEALPRPSAMQAENVASVRPPQNDHIFTVRCTSHSSSKQ